MRSAAIVLAFLGIVLVVPIGGSSGRQAVDTTIPTNWDWTRFGWDATRSNTSLAPTDIAAANIATLGRPQVQIDGLVDASAFYSAKCRKSILHQQARCGFVRQVRLFSFVEGERDGLLTRHVDAEVPPRVEYALTPLGKQFMQPVRGLVTWLQTHWPTIRAARDKVDGQSPSRKAS